MNVFRRLDIILMDRMIERWIRNVVRVIDGVTDWIGGCVLALLVLPLFFTVCYEVFARYVFNSPTQWAYDITFMIYGSLFMLGAGYTLLKGGHIRTDIFYDNWSLRTRGIIDALSYLFFFFPAMIMFFSAGLKEAIYAFQIGELSDATTWMPPLTPFKSTIPAAAALLLFQGISELLKSSYAAITGRQL